MGQSNESLVGVIVPCFNQGRFVVDCIGSLHSQTYTNWRAVVIDDASTDGVSGSICETTASEKVKVVRLERNLGRALVRNEAVRNLGPVDYLLNVDGDDKLSPGYIEQLVAVLDANANAGLAYGLLHYFGDASDASADKTWPNEPWEPRAMYLENVIPGPGVMFRQTALAQTDGWRSEFTKCSGEDYDIWLQVVEAGWEPIWVKDAKYHYRQHPNSFLASADIDTQLQVQLNILKLHIGKIRDSIGVQRFLRRLILPELMRALKQAEKDRVFALIGPLARLCPAATAWALAKHYSRRFAIRFRRTVLRQHAS